MCMMFADLLLYLTNLSLILFLVLLISSCVDSVFTGIDAVCIILRTRLLVRQ